MKKSSLLMIVVSLILSSCGIASQYTSTSSEARFQDGIYNSSPSFRSKEEKTESRAMTDSLIKQTKASEIYLFGEKKDTVMIPENMSASIRYDKSLSSTIVTVGENPYAWQNNLDLWSYYTPYSIGSSWYWSRHYDPWFNNYWYWNRWSYSPWSYYGYGGWYSGWYDPWYYGGIYDPWYYGGWYGYPYHYGWYHHHHCYPMGPVHVKDQWDGNRRLTGSDRVFASRVSTRGGVGSSARVSRVSSGQSGARTTSSVTRSTTAPKRVTTAPARASSAKRTATTVRTTPTPTGKVANHRRPAGTTARPASSSESVNRSTTGRSSTATYRSSSSSSSSSHSYSPGSSSSYRSNSTSTPSRTSSYSPSGAGRSTSGGGGASRSGGSPRR